MEISGLRERNEVAAGEIAMSQDLLKDTRREAVTLVLAKSEAERNVVTYLDDAAKAHRIARDISIAAKQKLTRAIKHAKAEARRETLEEINWPSWVGGQLLLCPYVFVHPSLQWRICYFEKAFSSTKPGASC